MSYTVKSYMNKNVNTIGEDVTVTEAAKVMAEKNSDYLIVLKEGKPTGIVTENDFLTKILAKEADPSTVKVSSVMSKPLIIISPDEDLITASEAMREHNIRKLPVVRTGIIYGMITAADIASSCGTYVDRSIKDIIRWAAPLSAF
jgi:CBS domain-containing protein